MYELTVAVEFEAAHRIVGYPGKCDRLHGHNWNIEITVAGEELDELGMLVDFKEVKKAAMQVADRLDHYYLNEMEPFQKVNPTAENIAKYIFDELSNEPLFLEKVKVRKVKVWESPKSAVSYSRGD